MHRHGPHTGRGRDYFFEAMTPHGHRGGPWGPPVARGGRMRRGDIRTALLAVLAEGAGHGYELIQRLEAKSGGAWRPSPGSVYPTLQQLEDEGLIRQEAGDGRTPYTLTDEGKAYVADHREELGEPWAKSSEGIGEERLELRGLIAQIAAAAFQVGSAGDDAQVTRAKELLAETRRGLYKILADDDPEA